MSFKLILVFLMVLLVSASIFFRLKFEKIFSSEIPFSHLFVVKQIEAILAHQDLCFQTFGHININYLKGGVKNYKINKIMVPSRDLSDGPQVFYMKNHQYQNVLIKKMELVFTQDQNFFNDETIQEILATFTINVNNLETLEEIKQKFLIKFLVSYNLRLDRFEKILSCQLEYNDFNKEESFFKMNSSKLMSTVFENENSFCQEDKKKVLQNVLMKNDLLPRLTSRCPYPVLIGCYDSHRDDLFGIGQKKNVLLEKMSGLFEKNDLLTVFNKETNLEKAEKTLREKYQKSYHCTQTEIRVIDECMLMSRDHFQESVLKRAIYRREKKIKLCSDRENSKKIEMALPCCYWQKEWQKIGSTIIANRAI